MPKPSRMTMTRRRSALKILRDRRQLRLFWSGSCITCRMKMISILVVLLSAIQASGQIRTPEQITSPDRLTISQAVAEALENNVGLLAARSNVSIAQARVITAGLRPNPIFSADGDHLPLAGTTFNAENDAGPPEYAVRTDFVIERGGKREQRIEVAQAA